MTKEIQKNYGIVLMILAAVILLSNLSYWRYMSYNIIDWAAIVICGYIGYMLYTEGNKK